MTADLRTTIALESSRNTGLQSAFAQSKAMEAEGKAMRAEEAAREAERKARMSASHGRHTDIMVATLQDQLEAANYKAAQTQNALDEKNALILEWMHSNQALKQLARKYGKKLGLSDEAMKSDYAEQVDNVADENPAFANTKLKEKYGS